MRMILSCCLTAAIGIAAFSWKTQAQAPETIVKAEGAAIVFIVNGQEQARIDDKGLHVKGDVAFTGMTVDMGTYPRKAGAQ